MAGSEIHHSDTSDMSEYWSSIVSSLEPCYFPQLVDTIPLDATRQSTLIDLDDSASLIHTFCSQNDITTSCFFQAVWSLVLRCYIGTNQVCFSFEELAYHGPENGVNGRIESTANSAICQANLSADLTLIQVLQQLQIDYDHASQHQPCSLDKLNEGESVAGQAIFNTTLIIDAAVSQQDSKALELMDTSQVRTVVTQLKVFRDRPLMETQKVRHAVSVRVSISPDHIKMNIFYGTSILSDGQVANMASTIKNAVPNLLENPNKSIGGIRLFCDNDWRQIMRWNHKIPEQINICAHEKIAIQALKSPDVLAVDAWDGKFTYQDLDQKSTSLAHFLVDQGVKPDMIIPLCFEKSSWAIVAMLAVMKAGGAMVFLDPSHPMARLEDLMDQIDGNLVLASKATAALWELRARVVVVEPDFVNSLPYRAEIPTTGVTPTNILYVVFTSGSTGRPKGCVVEHASFLTGAVSQASHKGFIEPSSRVMQIASYSFDVSILEIITSLIFGACICVPNPASLSNGLASVICDMDINWVFLTPSLARIISPDSVPCLKVIVLGGEALSKEDVDTWSDRVHLANGYGPSECSIAATVNPNMARNIVPTNIGRSMGSLCWVVEAWDVDRLVPVGGVGELLIEGPILARGYYKDSKKTMSAFIENPAWSQTSQWRRKRRFYKTGDLVRNNADGTINFIGRKDTQVKLRGQRIELGEIEFHVKRSIPGALDASIELVATADRPDDPILVAFFNFTIKQKETAAITDDLILPMTPAMELKLKEAEKVLRASMPSYMIPSLYIPLHQMPRMVSGKRDRNKLRSVAQELSGARLACYALANTERREASTEMEIALQQLWAEVLGIKAEAVGAEDNFFRIGGDSIAAMKLVAAARREGIRLEVTDIFRNSVLSMMAKVSRQVSNEKGDERLDKLVPFSLLPDTEPMEQLIEEIATVCDISKDIIRDAYPCTPLQEGLVALSIKEQQNTYIAQHVFTLSEDVDMARFQDAWNYVQSTTEILRTRIVHTRLSGSIQAVLDAPIIWQNSHDLKSYLDRDMRVKYYPGDAMLRFAFVNDQDHFGNRTFVLTAHHALYDGWSLPLILEKVALAYSSKPIEVSSSFNQFIKYLLHSDGATQNDFWKSQLANAVPSTFPTHSNTQPHQRIQHSMREKFYIPRSTFEVSAITLSTTIRAAWALVVAQHSKTTDVVFGATVAGRNAPVPGIATMLGPAIATVPVRISFDKNQTIISFLEQVQSQAADMMPFEHMGLQNIKRLGHDIARACDIQNILVVQPLIEHDAGSDLWGSESSVGKVDDIHTVPLVVECNLGNGCVVVDAHYDINVVPTEKLQYILGHFETAIQMLFGETAKRILGDIDLLGHLDKSRILGWNKGVLDGMQFCVHQLFENQVVLRPDNVAICSWDGEYTYRELDDLSTRLAKHLVSLGVSREILVRLCFDKSAWMIVAMLGVLKAGGTCVALDPKHPISRLQGILEDNGAKFVLAAQDHAHLFSEKLTVVVNESTILSMGLDTTFKLSSEVDPKHAAFVVYTSGSTGIPKGIVLEHHAVSATARDQAKSMRVDSTSRVFQFAAYSFDISIGDIISALSQGACVCIPSEQERLNDVAGSIRRLGATWACLTPTIASLIQPSDVTSLEVLVLAGEAPTRDNVTVWAEKVFLINAYGPAEGTIWSTCHLGVQNETVSTNIGQGLGTKTWVVDALDYNRLCPIGCIGELLIEGPSLARSYLNDPEKTAASFIESPAWIESNNSQQLQPRRFYKTGDLVQYNWDGTLNFLGRKDTQVKLHGVRIELGEIEHHVKARLPQRNIAVELIKTNRSEEPVLAVFFTTDQIMQAVEDEFLLDLTGSERTLMEDIDGSLADNLPTYMIPSLYVPVKNLPTTVSGKLNRLKLREIGETISIARLNQYSLSECQKRIPSTPAEEILQKLWAEVLNIAADTIGADDSFFRLGGDSVLAMKLVALARSHNLVLTTENIFRHRKLCSLALLAQPGSNKVVEVLPAFSLIQNTLSREDILREVIDQCGIEENDIQNVYPCTPLQESLVLLSSQQPGAYIAQFLFQLPQTMDLEKFQNSWQVLVNTVDILRTRIIYTHGAASFQAVISENLIWDKSASSVQSYLERDRLVPVSYGSLLTRYALIEDEQMGDGYYFVWTVHHALYDGWSIHLILNMLKKIYGGDAAGDSPPFTKFIEYLQGVDSQACGDYWKSRLAGTSHSQFPFSHTIESAPRKEVLLRHKMSLSSQSGTDITMSSMIRGAWALVVAQHSDTDDVVFGATLTGRNAPVSDLAQMLGPTITTVPVRVSFKREQSVMSFLEEIQNDATNMIPFEHTGLQTIKRLNQDTSSACKFQNLLVVQPQLFMESEEIADGPTWNRIEIDQPNFNSYPLVMECNLGQDTLDIEACFDSNVITNVEMTRILHQFEQVIHQLSGASHSTAIGEIDMLSAQEKTQILAWNDKKLNTTEACIHQLVQKQAEARPKAPAVCSWDGHLNFQQLDDLSNRLAHYLVKLGVKPESFVPLCFDKSMWTIVAMLGVLKAGGAYVAMDPAFPISRLRNIVMDVKARILLAEPKYCESFIDLVDQTMVLGQESIERLPENPKTVCALVKPNNAAFVVYTSGSTGKPKGIVLEHRGLSTVAHENGYAMNFRQDSRVLQFAAYSFDVSNCEIFTTLIHGGCICIPSETERLSDLSDAINTMNVNWAFLTPTVASLLKPSDVPCLKTLTLGGEAVKKDSIARWQDDVLLINSYGPAECTIWSSHALLGRDVAPANIGSGIGSMLWIADPLNHDRLLPIGCVGELLVEGPIVSRGYINDPAKTAEVFIEDVTWLARKGDPHRLYKTGDLVRYTSNGTIEYVGRKDTQVKVRGQRLELGEIEYNLSMIHSVQDAVAILPTSGLCKGSLLAVLSLSNSVMPITASTSLQVVAEERLESASLQISDMRENLGERVPSFMVPAIWIVVESLPLTMSGKINRKKIMDWVQEIDEQTYQKVLEQVVDKGSPDAPATATEKILQDLWCQVLNLPPEKINMRHSFLSIGGDSITAMQLVSTARARGIKVQVQDILKSKNIPQLALSVIQSGRLSKIIADPIERVFPLSPIQRWHFARDPLGGLRFNQSVLLRIEKTVSTDDVLQALNSMIAHHSMLRSRFQQTVEGEWLQRITGDIAGSLNYSEHKITRLDKISAIASKAQVSLNIREGPVLAADLILQEGNNQMLHLVVHHLVVDLVSWRVMLQDMVTLLQQKELAVSKPFPFQEWVKLQDDYAQQKFGPSNVLPFEIPAADFEYWNMDSRSNLYGGIVEEKFSIGADTTSRLLAGCHQALRTEPLDILIGALTHSFMQCFKDRSVPPVFLEGHGREPWDADIDLSTTVGWFTTIFPVYVPVEHGSDVVDAVRQSKDARHQIPANGLPYFISRFLNSEGIKEFASHSPSEFILNYEGLYQQAERADAVISLEEFSSDDISPLLPRPALFEVSVAVKHSITYVNVAYNRQMRNHDLIQKFVGSFKQSIEQAVASLTQMKPELTVSDFPLLKMNHAGFKKIMLEQLAEKGLQNPMAVEDIYPCSPMQEGILLSQQKNPDLYEVYDLSEVVVPEDHEVADITRLKDAWRQVVNRHSSLRTIFLESTFEDGIFYQVVLKHTAPRVLQIQCDEDEAPTMLQALAAAKHSGGQPLHQLTLCQTPGGKVLCKLEISHLLIDAVSRSIIYQDWRLAYEGNLGASPSVPYSEYIRYLGSASSESSMEYWTRYLRGIMPCHFPPLIDGVQQKEKSLKSFKFEVSSAPKLIQFAQENNLTLANLFQAVWGLILHSYTGSDQVCFGYVTAGRDIPVDGIQKAVGTFINMLVCRLDVSDQTSLIQVVKAVQDNYLDSLPHQHCSLARIQHNLGLSSQALFNSIMSFQSVPPEKSKASTMISFDIFSEQDPTEYDIGVNIEVNSGEININLKYWNTCLSDGQVKNVASAFKTGVNRITDDPHSKVEKINFFSEDHHRQVLAWNSVLPKNVDTCLHDLIALQLKAQPHAQALLAWDGKFTYSEVDSLTTQFACHLVSLGVGLETKVPFCLDKSAWAVISMLSIIKAGGACVALDPSHPVDRLKKIINKTKASLIISSPQHGHLFSNIVTNVVTVEPLLFTKIPVGRSEDLPRVSPTNAAFVIFTSGSTGEPKGIVTEHGSLSTSSLALQLIQNRNQNTRVIQFASYVFDVSISDTFMTLISGGCVCIPSEHDRLNNLAGVINEMQANWAHLTPTVASLLRPSDVPGLKTLVLGGEAVSKDIVRTWAGAVELILCYGPAECSVTCAGNRFVKASSLPNNVGHPSGSVFWITNTSNCNQLVPIGCVGELLLEGPILSRGYLGEEEMTAAAFIENPAFLPNVEPNRPRRMYKTGDLVRQNSDGTINIIGRKDRQVKLHGQRIELSAIEYSLQRELKNTTDIAVEMVKTVERPNEPVLVAFFCGPGELHQQGDENSPIKTISDDMQRELIKAESRLADVLPLYMIPSLYIPLKFMPAMLSCKRDSKKLQQLVRELSTEELARYALSNVSKRLPSTEFENVLQQLWAKVLNLPEQAIGADDSFFRLGGDSIAAIRLGAVASEKDFFVTVADIFLHPRLCDMALTMSTKAEHGAAISHPFDLLELDDTTQLQQVLDDIANQCGINKDEIEDAYPCTALQEGLLALSVKQQGSYVSRNIFSIPATVNIDRLHKAWEIVVDATDTLKTRIVYNQFAGALQVVLKRGIHWETTTSSLEEHVEQFQRSIHYGMPLTRFAMVGNDDVSGERYLVWTAHHAIYDGASMEGILNRVAEAYEGISIAKSIPFKGFIQYVTQCDVSLQKEYWTTQLRGAMVSKFPGASAAKSKDRLNQLVKHQVQIDRSQRSHITRSTVIRAAWALTVAGVCNMDNVVFGATLTGRNAPVAGIEKMIGPTITTVPVRVRIDYGEQIGEFLEAIQKQSTYMIPFEHTGLQNIRRLGSDAKIACDFQSLLVIQPHISSSKESNYKELMPIRNISATEGGFHTYPLVLACSIGKDSIDFDAHFDQNSISSKQVETILFQFGHIVNQLTTMTYDQLVGEVEQLSPEDKAQIALWNSASPTSMHNCIHQTIEQQAALCPTSPAICSWDGDFTYQDIDQLSSRLALHLISLGVCPETPVPFCFSKSAWAIIAMQAILKAGGTCVPLDPSQPFNQLQSIINTIDATIIITAPQHSDMLNRLANNIIAIDSAFFKTYRPTGGILPTVLPTNAAFIFFASDKTGKLNGIVIEHHSLWASSRAMQDMQSMNKESRVLQYSACTSDVGIADIFTTMMVGGCVCIPSEHNCLSDLAGAVSNTRANWAHLTPTVAESLRPSDVPSLTTMVLRGGIVTQKDVQTWARALELIICYSPAEYCGMGACNRYVTETGDPSNVGYPAGSIFWITEISNHNRLAPVSCVGQLLVEGPTLPREYLHDEEKTNSVFINNPSFLSQPNSLRRRRLYKTGDLARYNMDGTINIIKSKDEQVNLRGQRLDLGEIENHLSHLILSVSEVAVDLISFESLKDEVLVAFFSHHPDSCPADVTSQLSTVPVSKEMQSKLLEAESKLAEIVPSYMVPSFYIPLVYIPKNTSGKTDREELQKFASRLPNVGSYGLMEVKKHTPSTNMEKLLQRAWSSVLSINIERIGIDDSFFRLGGDSVAAMRLVAALRDENIFLSVAEIFQRPKLCDMSIVAQVIQTTDNDDEPQAAFSLMTSNTAVEESFTSNIETIDGDNPAIDGYEISSVVEINRHSRERLSKSEVVTSVDSTSATSEDEATTSASSEDETKVPSVLDAIQKEINEIKETLQKNDTACMQALDTVAEIPLKLRNQRKQLRTKLKVLELSFA